MTLRPDVMTA